MSNLKTIFQFIMIFAAAQSYAQIELQELSDTISPTSAAQSTPALNLPSAKEVANKTDIGYDDALVLGVVEGMTEYLPVSSTGHLIIANAFLNLDSDTPLYNAKGAPILDKKGNPYTMKMAADAYAIVIQFGAILAVGIVYWPYLLKMLFGVLGRNPEGFRLLRNLIVAFLPAAIIGFLFHGVIEEYLFGVKPVIFALAAGALLMLVVQKFYGQKYSPSTRGPKLEEMNTRQALLIGVLQCIAMWPGTSRSMMTILGGYIAGLRPAEAAKFSFLLGFMTLSAASIYKTYKDGEAILATISFTPLLLGIIIAFISAAFTVKWMLDYLTRRGLAPFAYYRLGLATILCVMLYFNLI